MKYFAISDLHYQKSASEKVFSWRRMYFSTGQNIFFFHTFRCSFLAFRSNNIFKNKWKTFGFVFLVLYLYIFSVVVNNIFQLLSFLFVYILNFIKEKKMLTICLALKVNRTFLFLFLFFSCSFFIYDKYGDFFFLSSAIYKNYTCNLSVLEFVNIY